MDEIKIICFIVMNKANGDPDGIYFDAAVALKTAQDLDGRLYQGELVEMDFRSRKRKVRHARD